MRLNTIRQGSGPAIVFLHGLGDSASTWTPVADKLAPSFETVAVDLLGHGESPHPDDADEYTRDRALEDVDDIVAGLAEAPVLVGHSLGGYLALAHAATRPDVARGLVLLNTGPGFRDDAKREAWNERSRRNAHRFGVTEHAALLNLQDDAVVMERLAEIQVPTLFLAGGDDRPEYQGSGQYLERKMPDARFVVLDGGGHSMHVDTHADEVATLIADFVGGIDVG